MADITPTANDRSEKFISLLTEHDRGILLFILSQVPNWADAEEIRQETTLRLWQQFDQFQLGSDFGKWARTIARYQVLTFKKRTQRDWLRMDQHAIDLVAAKVAVVAERETTRPVALAECVKELNPFGRELLRLYYTVGRKTTEIAQELNSTAEAVYKALQRVRLQLRHCVDGKLNEREDA
jgi:RNA polymerase sigma-70 factor (ECF subfamily)